MGEIKIYRIRPEQAGSIRGLLRPDAVEALQNELPVTALVAACDGVAAGAIAGALEEDHFRLDSIFVLQEYRRQGIGKKLLEALDEILDGEGYPIRASFSALTSEEQALKPFFAANDYEREYGAWPRFLVGTVDDIRMDFRHRRKVTSDKYKTVMFSKLAPEVVGAIEKEAEEAARPMPHGGFFSPDVLRDISACVFVNNTVQAYITLEGISGDLVEVSSLWSDLKDPRIMMDMLNEVASWAMQRLDATTRIAILAREPLTEQIAKKFIRNLDSCSYSFFKEGSQ